MNRKTLIQYIPLTILLLTVLLSISYASADEADLTIRHYIGFAFVLASLLTVIIHVKAGMLVTFVTLLLGTLDLIVFNTNYFITVVFFGLTIQIFSCCIFIIFVIINKRMISRILLEIFKAKEEN